VTSVDEYLEGIPQPRRRREAPTMLALMELATGERPSFSGTAAGFGQYHYRYASGREGHAAPVGFAARKAAVTVYVMDGVRAHPDLLGRLGPHTTGVGCIYIRDLDAIDLSVLEQIVARSYARVTAGTYALRARDGSHHFRDAGQGDRGSGSAPA
jgi:hypothetical protein